MAVLRTSPWEVPETLWAQGGPRSDTRDLWPRWWKGPSDPSVGGGPGLWERLTLTKTKRHKDKAVSYA